MPNLTAPRRPLFAALALLIASQSGCTLKSDAEYAVDQSRRRNEAALRAMQQATQQTARGSDLAGDALTAALAGKTLVKRYASKPGGAPGPYVVRQYFAADGRYRYLDEPRLMSWPGGGDTGHRWRVDGARLCIKGPPAPQDWKCYRVARSGDGALQWFIDEPGGAYDRQLTMIITEFTDGPPAQ